MNDKYVLKIFTYCENHIKNLEKYINIIYF